MSERIAYFDCFSGASGDMLLGALLDAGLELPELKSDLAGLGVGGYELVLARLVSHGISGSRLAVVVKGGDRPARNLPMVVDLLEHAALPSGVVEASINVFQRLAEAEAKVHGVPVDEVHFHEVGAVDTLVDVVGFCSAIARLGIGATYSSPLPLGGGTIRTEHGLLPVPAPATLALLAAARAPVVHSDAQAELVTPTGAAILTTLARFAQPPMTIERIGYGFGAKELPWANALRVWIGRALAQPGAMDEAPSAHEHSHGHTHSSEHGEVPQEGLPSHSARH